MEIFLGCEFSMVPYHCLP